MRAGAKALMRVGAKGEEGRPGCHWQNSVAGRSTTVLAEGACTRSRQRHHSTSWRCVHSVSGRVHRMCVYVCVRVCVRVCVSGPVQRSRQEHHSTSWTSMHIVSGPAQHNRQEHHSATWMCAHRSAEGLVCQSFHAGLPTLPGLVNSWRPIIANNQPTNPKVHLQACPTAGLGATQATPSPVLCCSSKHGGHGSIGWMTQARCEGQSKGARDKSKAFV
eukprot:scaffold72581_cov24-Tisochrysis_lutea.AAC.1